MKGKPSLNWLAANFLWYLFIGFFLSYIPTWAQAIVLPVALALTLCQAFHVGSIVILPLTSALAAGSAFALAGNLVEENAGNLATAFAMVIFLGWTAPGVWSLLAAGAISLTAAFIWARMLPSALVFGAAWMGTAASIFAVMLPEVVSGARFFLMQRFSQNQTTLIIIGTSLLGLLTGTLGRLIR